MLLVPGRIGGGAGRGAPHDPFLRMPRAWEFQIEFNEKNGHPMRVVYGDHALCADYIKAHDDATDRAKEVTR